MKYIFSACFLIFILSLLANGSKIIYKEPLSNTCYLDSLINLNDKPFYKDSIVVVYTYLSCRPCQVLADKIQKKFNHTDDIKRIVFVNDVDIAFDTLKVKQHLQSNAFPFPYLLTKNPDINGTYPLICFYNAKGQLIKSLVGYNNTNFSAIKQFLE